MSFHAKPSRIEKGKGIYCSKACHYKDKRTGETFPCSVCGTEIYRKPRQMRKSKSTKFFCSKSCQAKWRNVEFSGVNHASYKNGSTTYRTVLKHSGEEEKCKLCGTEDKRILAVHHIDMNHSNNVAKNLAWLCHNCHFLVHHHKEPRERFTSLL